MRYLYVKLTPHTRGAQERVAQSLTSLTTLYSLDSCTSLSRATCIGWKKDLAARPHEHIEHGKSELSTVDVFSLSFLPRNTFSCFVPFVLLSSNLTLAFPRYFSHTNTYLPFPHTVYTIVFGPAHSACPRVTKRNLHILPLGDKRLQNKQ